MEEKENKENKENKDQDQPKQKQNKLVVVLVITAVILAGLYFLGKTISRKMGEGLAGRFLSGISGKNVKIDGKGDKVTIADEDGGVSFEAGGSLPQSFPKDFPIYSGAKIISSFTAKGEDGDGVSVVWETGDSFSQVVGFYKKNLQEGGWVMESTFEQKDSFTSTFKKGEMGGFLGVTPGDNSKVSISVTLGVK